MATKTETIGHPPHRASPCSECESHPAQECWCSWCRSWSCWACGWQRPDAFHVHSPTSYRTSSQSSWRENNPAGGALVNPCLSLHARWHSCRSRVYGEEMVRDFAFCNLWKPNLTREEALSWSPARWHRWPCCSPRRRQCRNGGRPTPPQGWGPNDGWFQWPGPRVEPLEIPEQFVRIG